MRQRFETLLAALFCTAWSALALACAPGEATPPRALVIGIDGATLDIVRPLMAAGRLPNLASLADTGVHGELVSALPIQSPRIWNTIVTGKTPARHGILSFTFDAPNGDRRLYLSRHRKTPALWNILTHHGMSVSAINWWNTWPPERIKGVMVSDHFFPGQLSGREALFKADGGSGKQSVSPPTWQTRAKQELENAPEPTAFRNPFTKRGELPRWAHLESLADVFDTDRRIAQLSLAIADAETPRVLMVYFPGIDRVCHTLWIGVDDPKNFPPKFRLDAAAMAASRAAVENYYVYTDAMIGRLLERFGPEDLVVVLSDHGFEAQPFGDPVKGALVLTGGHKSPDARDGLLFARGPRIAPGSDLLGMTIADVTPTILAWLGLPVSNDMDGDVARFLEAEEIARVANYADVSIEREQVDSSVVEGEIVDQLRDLGYID